MMVEEYLPKLDLTDQQENYETHKDYGEYQFGINIK